MTDFPPPATFGLPAHFAQWRPGQIDAILHATESPERMAGLVLPTGFGKSLVYMAAAHMSGARAVILTSTKALQRQLMNDFATLGATLVQGQSSYICKALQPGGELVSGFGGGSRETVMVDHGPCHLGAECTLKMRGCGYYDAVREAQRATITITNYAWWFTLPYQPQIRLVPDLLILDEAHAAPDALADALGASIYARDIKETLRQELPGAKTRTAAQWREWAEQHSNKLVKLLAGATASNRDTARRIRRAQWLQKSLQRVAAIDARLLLVSDEPEAVRFDVVWAAPYAERVLFRSIKRVLLTSATFTPHTATLLGVTPDELSIHEAGAGFPKERRPVYVAPAMFAGVKPVRVDHRLSDVEEQAWLDHIDAIIGARLDRNGLIHTVSYKRRDAILARSKYRDRMVTHGRQDAADKIRQFKEGPRGRILVSPSVTTGYDFPYRECEYQIVSKVPFPDSRDPVTAARTMIDPRYPNHLAMQELVQSVGRGMRADDDQCECVAVGTRVLTADLRWRPVEQLRKGDRLLAFDESPLRQGRGYGRRWRWAEVQANILRTAQPRFVVRTAHGIVTTTPNHLWLVIGRNAMQQWKRTDQLALGDTVVRLCDVWDEPTDYESGWLSGFTDGEGALVLRHGTRNPNVTGIYLVQNPGAVLDRAQDWSACKGFNAHRYKNPKVTAEHLRIAGGFAEHLRFLGQLRPIRLLSKFTGSPRNEKFAALTRSRIEAVQRVEDGAICTLQTSTRTFIAEGFAMHNTFIVDAHAGWFLSKNADLAPRWFRRAIQRLDTLPTPPPPLSTVLSTARGEES